MNTVLIDYGAGNIKSIQFALQRLGVNAILSKDATVIQQADKVIFPGVGEAGFAMQKLKESKLDSVIPKLQQPVLGICLGMQLLCKHTAESNTEGLGIFNTTIERFSNKVKVPSMGWNTIYDLRSPLFDNIKEQEYMYLVHSYYAVACNEAIATTNYDVAYAAALQHQNFYGVQFHPEKSGVAGARILENFLKL